MKKFLTLIASLLFGASAFSAVPFSASDSVNVISDNTNQVVVYNIGDTTLRGTYTLSNAINGFVYYTNNNGNGKMVVADVLDADFGIDYKYAITNGNGTILYGISGTPLRLPAFFPQALNRVSGIVGNGTITWGTNVTKTTVTSGGNDQKWYITTNGNDITAIKGDPLHPAASLYRVATNLAAWDVVLIGPGHFTNNFGIDNSSITFPGFDFPANVTIQGSGIGVTYIDGPVSAGISPKWRLGNSNVVSDFTAANLWLYDRATVSSPQGTTNIIIHDVAMSAAGDVIVFNNTMNANLWNLYLDGSSDKIADLSQGAAYAYLTNSIINMNNIYLTGGGGAGGNGMNFGNGAGGNGFVQPRGGGIHVNVTGVVAEQHVVTNAPFGNFLFAPVTIRTNFIGGQKYTNNWSVDVRASATVSNVIANAAGASRTAAWSYPQAGSAGIAGTTNFAGDYHQAMGATVAFTNLVPIFIDWRIGQVLAFTNQSSGVGNDSQVINGQIYIP